MMHRKSNVRYIFTTTLILLTSSLPLFAEEESEKRSPTISRAAKAAQNIALARDLERLALETENPLALLTAAEILVANPLEGKEKECEFEIVTGDTGGESPEKSATPKEMVGKAEEMALEQELEGFQALANRVLRMIDRGSKGAIPQAMQITRSITPSCVHRFKTKFQGFNFVHVHPICKYHDMDLDLIVEDVYGNVISHDNGVDRDAHVTFKGDGVYVIIVKQYSGHPGSYQLTSN